MKTRWVLCSIALFGVLGYGGCRQNGSPTEVTGGLSLEGAWAGTIDNYDSPACARENIAVALSQVGAVVRGSFRTSCHGMLDLRGETSDGRISGEISTLSDGLLIGQISGTISRTSIHISTWRPLAREDRGPRQRVVVNVIDLTR
jgi:hypothetical protein